jgi:enoyl-CoA hydratase
MPALLYEKRDGIAYITFNRPEVRNAMDPEVVVRLAEAWQDFGADDEARVALITGAGDAAFSAGADLGRLIPLFSRARQPDDEWDEKLMADRRLMDVALLRGEPLYKPVVAAINGFCLAGGTELIQACDIRVAAEHARFGLTEVTRGIIPGGGSLARLPRQIPYCKAMEIILTGKHMDAQEAWRIGLINEVMPADQVLARAEEYARMIAANGPLAVRACKEAIIRGSGVPLEQAYAIESEMSRAVMRSEDAKEGPRAFMEKRPPRFIGR